MRRISTPLLIVGLWVLYSCGSNPAGPAPPTIGPPAITCPSPVTITSTGGQPTPVTYGTPTVTLGESRVTTACTPPSGSTFQIGATTVTCVATDALQRTDQCTFTVTVAQPPTISLTRFDAFGDSITWGENGADAAGFQPLSALVRPRYQFPLTQTYPGALQLLLQGYYTAQTQLLTVHNDGNPGELAGDPNTATRLETSANTGVYQAILLMEGANDVILQSADNGSTAPVDAAIANLQTMIDYAKARNVRPYLATITPQNGAAAPPPPYVGRGSGANFVVPYNTRVSALAQAEGITLVDVYTPIAGDPSWPTKYIGPDGLHPTVGGYALIAQTFLNALKSTLGSTATPTRKVTAPASSPGRTGSSATRAAAGPDSRLAPPKRP